MNNLARGSFTVQNSEKLTFDYLFDGGWWQGELGIYNLAGMEAYPLGSVEYIAEASKRAVSNSSEEGYLIMSDRSEGAKYSASLPWESDFNQGEYLGEKTFSVTNGDRFGFIFTQDATLEELATNPESYTEPGKTPIFSIPEANPDGDAPQQFAALDDHGTFSFEAVRVDQSDRWQQDYNEVVFRLLGATAEATSEYNYDNLASDNRNFLQSDVGQQIVAESKQKADEYEIWQKSLDNGILQVGDSGEVTIDAVYDGGWYQGEVGIFSLEGIPQQNLNSADFIQEAATRALSNSTEGYTVFQDSIEGAYSGNFNQGVYPGSKTFQLNPGDRYALLLVPNGTLSSQVQNPSIHNSYFSLNAANYQNAQQMTYRLEDDTLVVGWEDTSTINNPGDYNDLVLSIEGATISAPEYQEIAWQWYQGINPVANNNSESIFKDQVTSITVETLLEDDYVFGDEINFDSFNTTNTVGIVNLNGDSLTYDPNGQFDELQTGETATDSFTYTITDRAGKTATATVDITIQGFHDHQTLMATPGNDTFLTSTGNDNLDGKSGHDHLSGNLGNDTLVGASGYDTLNGDDGDDLLDGGAGKDVLDGGAGNDTLRGSYSADTLNGGAGDDLLDGGVGKDLLDGGAGNDTLTASHGRDILDGGTGDDLLDGGTGNDTLSGGAGNDHLTGNDGHDIINGGTGNDTIITGYGRDRIIYDSALPERGRYYAYLGSYNADTDTIVDFTIGSDKVDLSRVLGSGNPLDHDLISLSGDNNATLSYDGFPLMVFQDISAEELNHPHNFIF